MSDLFGATVEAIEDALRFRGERQGVLSSNVANADTPGYRRFELVLQEQTAGAMRRTNASHVASRDGVRSGYQLERGDYGTRPDRNGVDLDHELLELSRNAGAFEQQAEILSRLFSLRRIAITGESR